MGQRISDKVVRSLEPPVKGYAIHYDSEVGGFGVRVTAGGVKTFIISYRTKDTGRSRRKTIGRYPTWTVLHARNEAKALKQRVDRGEDPQGALQEVRRAPTVNDLIERYYEHRHFRRKAPSSQQNDKRIIAQWIRPELGRMRVAEVRRRDARQMHHKISERTPVRANRVLAVLSKMMSLAITDLEWRSDNPVRGIERNQEIARQRYLSTEEIARLIEALDRYPRQSAANAVRFLLLTGARRAEVMQMTWDQVDFGEGRWTKPSAHTKQKKEHRVPLSPPALQMLAQIKDTSDGDCIFPGRKPSSPIQQLRSVWDWVSREAGIEHANLHDLRHTYASLLASSGLSLPIIGQLLGHTQPRTTARYAHLYDDPLREATGRVGVIVTAAKRPKADVVDLRRGECQ